MKRVIDFIRRRNRARLERRQLMKATGELPRGWLARLVYRFKALNRERLAKHRLQKQLLTSLAANDTAVLEALVALLETFRQDRRARGEADEALAKRLDALEERVETGVRLVNTRIQVMEGRLGGTRRGEAIEPDISVLAGRPAASPGAVNGETRHALAPHGRVAERVEPGEAERVERDGKSRLW
jgi:hypothetical protein